jgi:acetylornithine deacetylase
MPRINVLLLLILLAASALVIWFSQLPIVALSTPPAEVPYELDTRTTDALLSLHKSLVEIESISGNEGEVGKWLASYLQQQNLTVELQEVEPNRYNVLAYPGTERKTKILVTSHIDTVRNDSVSPFGDKK